MEIPVPYNPDGRPKLDPEKRRSELLKSYVTPEESEEIKLRCRLAGMSISDFLRRLALDQEIKAQANPEELKQIRAQVGRVAGNINQIAKKVNQGKVDRLDAETVEMETIKDGETVAETMNFGELILYLKEELNKLEL